MQQQSMKQLQQYIAADAATPNSQEVTKARRSRAHPLRCPGCQPRGPLEGCECRLAACPTHCNVLHSLLQGSVAGRLQRSPVQSSASAALQGTRCLHRPRCRRGWDAEGCPCWVHLQATVSGPQALTVRQGTSTPMWSAILVMLKYREALCLACTLGWQPPLSAMLCCAVLCWVWQCCRGAR